MELRRETPDGKWYTPEELVDELMKDNWYFITTSGGVTFSGGEPLLRYPFIKEFCGLCPQDWSINVETSLNVPARNVDEVLPFVDTFIVDVKDTNPGIYSRYTGESVNQVMCNLDALSKEDANVVVRLPLIPEFNTEEDVEKSVEMISYIHMENGFMYLYAIIDVYSRYIVGWGLYNTLDASNAIEVLERAIVAHGTPEIINSDQGVQYTCEEWHKACDRYGIRISMRTGTGY